MYEVFVEGQFSAAHRLENYHGKCEALHGHNWKVRVAVRGDSLNDSGMLLDFTVLKRALAEVLDEFDHKFLNEVSCMQGLQPSAENLARRIFEMMSAKLDKYNGVKVARVQVWESETACAVYFEED